jgi:hypothetical protein
LLLQRGRDAKVQSVPNIMLDPIEEIA